MGHNNQSTEAFAKNGFLRSCFCSIITLIEPSIILSTYIFSLEEARHKTLHMKPEANTLSDSGDFQSLSKSLGERKKTKNKQGWYWKMTV